MPAKGDAPVAIVDDDAAVLDSLRLLLEVLGYRVMTYSSAAAFLADQPRHFACLVLDHHMPEMSGLDVVARLHTAKADIPVLLMTAMPSSAIIARAARLGVDRVLEKPPTEDDLIGFVSAHH